MNFQKTQIFPLGTFVTSPPSFLGEFNIVLNSGPIAFLGIRFTHNGNDLFRLNYLQKLSRLKKQLRLWSTRDLTPIGRNVIVKTFAISQLVYLFQVLPNPPKKFIQEVQGVISDFIWGGAPDKVKRNTMINPIDHGGIKVIHVESFAYALKTSWIKRFIDNSKTGYWKIFFNAHLAPFGKEFLFQCNFRPSDVTKIDNVFIREVCEAWSMASFVTPCSNYGNQIIWNNHLVKINNSIFYFSKLHEAGLLYVKDLFRDNGSPISYREFCDKFNVTRFPFTKFFGMLLAIPSTWKSPFQGGIDLPPSDPFINTISKIPKLSRQIYAHLIRRISIPPRVIVKWNLLFDLNDDDWNVIFRIPFHSLRETKVQYFQFKFLHRLLATNRYLHLMKKCESPICTFCKIASETIEHLFWDCHVTASFLLDCEQLFFGRQFILTKKDFFFGYNLVLDHPMNFFILHCKYYIYNCKLNQTLPKCFEFFYKMKFILKVETHINSKPCVPMSKLRNFNELKGRFAHCLGLFS